MTTSKKATTVKPRKAAKQTKAKDDKARSQEAKKQIEQLKELSGKVIGKLPLLGPVSWLYMNDKGHRHLFVTDLEWLVLPPLVLNQCKLYVKGDAPVAYASWAFVSDVVAQRLASGNNRLAPGEWKSGENLWVLDICAPFGGVVELVKDLKENVHKGKQINTISIGPNGKAEPGTL